MKKTITIAIPVYNGEKYISEALQSIINQTVKVDKIIVSNNCSTDNTVAIVNQFAKDHPSLDIELSSNSENLGFQGNLYKCFDLAKTDFLLILASDDVLKPQTIEKQLSFFAKHPDFAIVGGKADVIDANGKVLIKNTKTKDLLFDKNEIYEFLNETGSYIAESSVMYNLKLSKQVDFIDEDSLGPEELYWPNLLKVHPIAILGESLFDNRFHDGQLHLENSIEKFDESIKFFKDKLKLAELENTKERQQKTKNILKRRISRISIKEGQDSFQFNKNLPFVMKYYCFGIRQDFRIVFTKYFYKSIFKAIFKSK